MFDIKDAKLVMHFNGKRLSLYPCVKLFFLYEDPESDTARTVVCYATDTYDKYDTQGRVIETGQCDPESIEGKMCKVLRVADVVGDAIELIFSLKRLGW